MLSRDHVTLRRGGVLDADAVAEILNHYIHHTTATFMTEPVTLEDRLAWIKSRKPEHAFWVAERNGRAVGWAALSEHRPRTGFEHTVENSIYLHPNHRRQGLGLKLLNRVIEDAYRHGFHTMIAGVCTEQEPSIRLHERAGFTRVAHYREVAQKYNRWLDVVYLQRMLTPQTRPAGPGGLLARPHKDRS
ncbi:MAG: N-acetyltransferase family protein [Leptothrix sp. (in: b-proteobacteria)]